MTLIEGMQTADMLRNQTNLKKVLEGAIRLICPPGIAHRLHAQLHEDCPSSSTVQRGRLSWDVAFAIYMRRQLVWDTASGLTAKPTYMWLDSSPLGGRQMLVAHFHMLENETAEQMLQTVHAVDSLVQAAAARS